jgi:hypothetical protein
MSNALKNAVDAGTSTLSDLVDDARSLIEELPPLANARRKQSRKNWSSVFVAVLLVFVAMVVAKQVRSHSSDPVPERNTL